MASRGKGKGAQADNEIRIPLTRPYLSEEEVAAASDVIRSGWLTQGPKVKELEKKFASFIGCKDAVAVSSCTAALHLSLIAAGIGEGDEVICPSYTFIATPNSIIHAGAKPVFVDIDPRTYNINPESIEAAITPNTKAIMPAYQGSAAGIKRIYEIADRHNLLVIEDAAPAVGAIYDVNKRLGSESYLCCFSLHPRKVITCGEGGLIAANSSELAGKLRKLRHHSMSVSDLQRHNSNEVIFESYPEIGYNYRMTDIQAAIASVQLDRLEGLILKRRELAERYNIAFERYPWIALPVNNKEIYNTYQSYMIRLTPRARIKRDTLMKKLMEKGISTRRGFLSCHKEEFYRDMYSDLNLPETEYCTDNCIILPLYPALNFKEQDYVMQHIERVINEAATGTPAFERSLR